VRGGSTGTQNTIKRWEVQEHYTIGKEGSTGALHNWERRKYRNTKPLREEAVQRHYICMYHERRREFRNTTPLGGKGVLGHCTCM
jgi:hypothetical protein